MDALALLEGRIGELRALLAAAEPIEENSSRDGVIRLGARVKIRHEDGEEAQYLLVSPAEADPRRGRISERPGAAGHPRRGLNDRSWSDRERACAPDRGLGVDGPRCAR